MEWYEALTTMLCVRMCLCVCMFLYICVLMCMHTCMSMPSHVHMCGFCGLVNMCMKVTMCGYVPMGVGIWSCGLHLFVHVLMCLFIYTTAVCSELLSLYIYTCQD